jgi:PEP-CTERM motif
MKKVIFRLYFYNFRRRCVMRNLKLFIFLVLFGMVIVTPAFATSFFFSTGDPDGKIATASRPDSTSGIEIETADDFVLTSKTAINQATFTGLVPSGASVQQVIVEIYRIFPTDSNVGRTSGPPTFSTSQVPTRVNSPSDVALASFDSAAGKLSFSTTNLGAFDANNSVLNGINPKPNQTTGGEGPVTGQEVLFDVTFAVPFDLPADHYFFVPQVLLDNGNFFWLSAARPIVSGTPFPTGFTDLQSWIRNADLDPDWLRVGTDIIGPPPTEGSAPTFNAAFSLTGNTVPEPSTFLLLGAGLAGVRLLRRRFKK